MTKDYFVAEDITQETFLAVYEKWNLFHREEAGSSEKAWICRIASNKCIDYLRAAARRALATEDELLTGMCDEESRRSGKTSTREGMEGPLDKVLNQELLQELKMQCSQLPEPYAEVAQLHLVEGFSAKEIAERKQMNLKTIQTQIYRSKAMLRKTIRKEDLLA